MGSRRGRRALCAPEFLAQHVPYSTPTQTHYQPSLSWSVSNSSATQTRNAPGNATLPDDLDFSTFGSTVTPQASCTTVKHATAVHEVVSQQVQGFSDPHLKHLLQLLQASSTPSVGQQQQQQHVNQEPTSLNSVAACSLHAAPEAAHHEKHGTAPPPLMSMVMNRNHTMHQPQEEQRQQGSGSSHSSQQGPQVSALPAPSFTVGHQGDWVDVPLDMLSIWEQLGLEPYGPQKPVAYWVLCPEHMVAMVRMYLKEVAGAYHSCKLGTHTPAESTSMLRTIAGIVPIPMTTHPLMAPADGQKGGNLDSTAAMKNRPPVYHPVLGNLSNHALGFNPALDKPLAAALTHQGAASAAPASGLTPATAAAVSAVMPGLLPLLSATVQGPPSAAAAQPQQQDPNPVATEADVLTPYWRNLRHACSTLQRWLSSRPAQLYFKDAPPSSVSSAPSPPVPRPTPVVYIVPPSDRAEVALRCLLEAAAWLTPPQQPHTSTCSSRTGAWGAAMSKRSHDAPDPAAAAVGEAGGVAGATGAPSSTATSGGGEVGLVAGGVPEGLPLVTASGAALELGLLAEELLQVKTYGGAACNTYIPLVSFAAAGLSTSGCGGHSYPAAADVSGQGQDMPPVTLQLLMSHVMCDVTGSSALATALGVYSKVQSQRPRHRKLQEAAQACGSSSAEGAVACSAAAAGTPASHLPRAEGSSAQPASHQPQTPPWPSEAQSTPPQGSQRYEPLLIAADLVQAPQLEHVQDKQQQHTAQHHHSPQQAQLPSAAHHTSSASQSTTSATEDSLHCCYSWSRHSSGTTTSSSSSSSSSTLHATAQSTVDLSICWTNTKGALLHTKLLTLHQQQTTHQHQQQPHPTLRLEPLIPHAPSQLHKVPLPYAQPTHSTTTRLPVGSTSGCSASLCQPSTSQGDAPHTSDISLAVCEAVLEESLALMTSLASAATASELAASKDASAAHQGTCDASGAPPRLVVTKAGSMTRSEERAWQHICSTSAGSSEQVVQGQGSGLTSAHCAEHPEQQRQQHLPSVRILAAFLKMDDPVALDRTQLSLGSGNSLPQGSYVVDTAASTAGTPAAQQAHNRALHPPQSCHLLQLSSSQLHPAPGAWSNRCGGQAGPSTSTLTHWSVHLVADSQPGKPVMAPRFIREKITVPQPPATEHEQVPLPPPPPLSPHRRPGSRPRLPPPPPLHIPGPHSSKAPSDPPSAETGFFSPTSTEGLPPPPPLPPSMSLPDSLPLPPPPPLLPGNGDLGPLPPPPPLPPSGLPASAWGAGPGEDSLRRQYSVGPTSGRPSPSPAPMDLDSESEGGAGYAPSSTTAGMQASKRARVWGRKVSKEPELPPSGCDGLEAAPTENGMASSMAEDTMASPPFQPSGPSEAGANVWQSVDSSVHEAREVGAGSGGKLTSRASLPPLPPTSGAGNHVGQGLVGAEGAEAAVAASEGPAGQTAEVLAVRMCPVAPVSAICQELCTLQQLAASHQQCAKAAAASPFGCGEALVPDPEPIAVCFNSSSSSSSQWSNRSGGTAVSRRVEVPLHHSVATNLLALLQGCDQLLSTLSV